MFDDESQTWDADVRMFLTRSEAEEYYATKAEIPAIAGGLDLTLADARYAPLSHGHTGVYQPVGNYATVSQIPDVSGKANTTDVATALATKANVTDVTAALAGKSDTTHTHATLYAPISGSAVYASQSDVLAALLLKSGTDHTHTGVYQPVGAYLVAADIAGKANTSDVTTALAGKADATHTHTGTYAPATGSTVYATKDEVTEATGGGLTLTAGDARYVQQANLFVGVTDITDQLYPAKQVTYSKTEVDDAIGSVYANVYTITDTDTLLGNKANTSDVTTALAGKADATHTHSGTYAPVSHTHPEYAPQSSTYTKTEVDTALATKQATGSYQTTTNMVTVGSETTYYSGAKVDALLVGVGSGGTTFTYATFYSPDNTVYNPTFPGGFGGVFYFHWNNATASNTTPLTLCTAGSGTNMICIQNQTSNSTYKVHVDWTLQSLANFQDTSFVRARTLCALVRGLVNNPTLAQVTAGTNTDMYGLTDGVAYCRIDSSSAQLVMAPGDVFYLACWSGTSYTGGMYTLPANTWVPNGKLNRLQIRCWS